MAKNFFDRVAEFYVRLGESMKAHAAANHLSNPSDLGSNRELNVMSLLEAILPKKCTPILGGSLFGADGSESGQIDVVVIGDAAPRFNLPGIGQSQKAFSPVDGTIGVVSVKSKLTKKELHDALENIASIPPVSTAVAKVSPNLNNTNYQDFPAKVVMAHAGMTKANALSAVNDYYLKNPHIPYERKPEIIHVVGEYLLIRGDGHIGWQQTTTGSTQPFAKGVYYVVDQNVDKIGFSMLTRAFQHRANIYPHILFDYFFIVAGVSFAPTPSVSPPAKARRSGKGASAKAKTK